MSLAFIILAVLALASAVAVMALRNLVHCALALTVTFASLAGLYLQLGAQFVGFAQILIYIGAVAILIVFAILLTRGSEPPRQAIFSSGWAAGILIALTVFAVLGSLILSSRAFAGQHVAEAPASVADIGTQLMTKYVLPLEVLGLLLTVGLIGAAIIALNDRDRA